MKLIGSMKNVDGVLEIGGISVKKLAEEYKTPLFIYDLELIEKKISNFVTSFKSDKFRTTIVYASKAYLSRAMVQVVDKFGLHIDAVSLGELYTILNAGIDPSKVHMHGNNKSVEELHFCVKNSIGSVILDNRGETSLLEEVCRKENKSMNVMLRLNIGIDAHTHEYIKTAKHSSKFGESIFSKDIYDVVKEILNCEHLNFKGFHCHIGSQIFDSEAFLEGIETMVKFTKKVSDKLNVKITDINLGGGFGVRYTDEDESVNLKKMMKKMIIHLEETLSTYKLEVENVIIEPGRSIVAEAGSTLYSIGGLKKTFSGERYVFVDGGMSDNIRPSLYQAKYEGIVANKLNEKHHDMVTIAGKFCESGDVLIKNIKLEICERDDLLVIPCTGAYGYSMSSNYNKALKPAVVFVKNGNSYLVTKREELSDLTKNDLLIEY